VNVTVTPVADPPAATNDAANTAPGVPVAISVLANDSDPDGDALTVSAVTQPADGSAAIAGGGQSITYTPPAGFTGSASFSYTASDGNGGTSTATVTVTVSSAPPNQPPVARNDFARTRRTDPVVVNVLVNDADPNGDPLSVTAVGQPANGTATISGGGQTVTYRANAGFLGTNIFTYTISDGRGGTATASVWVAVLPVQLPPFPPPPPPPPQPTRADLAIAIVDSPDPAVQGQNVSYQVTIRNRGPAASQPATMRIVWLSRVGPPQPPGPGSTCQILLNPNGYRCSVPAIPAGSQVQSTFFLLNPQPGEYVVLTEVTPTPLSSDPSLGNNVALARTTVRRLGGFGQIVMSAGSDTASARASAATAAAQASGGAPSAPLGWEVSR
jgi:hypothetical protein